MTQIFGETVKYHCEVTLSTAHNQKSPGITAFHDDLLAALQAHFNKPTTPFYVSEVSVTGISKAGRYLV